MARLTDLLQRGPVLFDGAMGTEIMARGVTPGRCLEELNLIQPALVLGIHRDYIAAGADVIETNTFGANRFGLGDHYLESRVAEINRAGARLAIEARNASGRPVLVAGSVGPLGRAIEPVGAIKRTSAERIFTEQVQTLAEAGVDLLVFETFTSLPELELAVGVARRVVPRLPVLASLSFDEEVDPSGAAAALVAGLAPLSVEVIGANCGSGLQAALDVARHLLAAGAPAVSVMPNAGLPGHPPGPGASWAPLPRRAIGRVVYPTGPAYFAEQAARLVAEGVRVVGGCCGAGPAHIAALRSRLAGVPSVRRPPAGRRWAVGGHDPSSGPRPPAPPRSRLAEALARGRFVISVELTPPRGIDPGRVLAGARLLAEAGVEFANVTDTAMARLRMGVISCAALIQQQVGLEAVAHFTCRDRNVMAIQSELIGAHALGIHNVLALRGDPPRVGDHPHARPVWEVNAVGLITILANLNRGLDANGTPIGERTSFLVGAVVNPGAEDFERELRLLRRKIAAGAAFVITNPVYTPAARQRIERIAALARIPVLVGVMPLASARHAEYLHHEVPGISVPGDLRRRLAAAGDRAAELGLELAGQFLDSVRPLVQGAYVIPPGARYELAVRLVQRLRQPVG
ncbi:MAG TPA: bifunctional homocysteine S-methyltransferase/methylenetetrahydrofolate reductase [Candidatus Dormibacteraeota bacterium]|nr:bifunctional homocysteine S-methyltransferase/methylenetetrahydrofolate reductase [Candidatus Dormibacteraeota bacterium]